MLNYNAMSNRNRECLKINMIGQSAAELPGDRSKVQRLEKVIFGMAIRFHRYIYTLKTKHMQEEISPSAEHRYICRVCNKSFIAITNTHLKRHNMTTSEYHEKFPDAEFGNFSRFSTWLNSDENRINLIRNNKLVYETPELLEKKRRNKRLACSTLEYKKKLSEANKKASKTDKMQEYYKTAKQRTSPLMKMSNYDRWVLKFGIEEANKRQKDWTKKNKLPSKSKDTLPELMFKKVLDDNFVKYCQQYDKIPGIYCDFFLSDYNIIVEIDGDYWHANPKTYKADDIIGKKGLSAKQIWHLDEERNKKIIKNNLSIIRYWASELKNKTYENIYEDIVHASKKLEDES